MSVLIRGMEMPKSCGYCPFKYRTMEGGECMFGVIQMDYQKRPDDCPAGPVPPHGRLIESVELYGKAEDIKTKALSACDKPQSWQFGAFWTIEQIEAALANGPTIIPASEEGER